MTQRTTCNLAPKNWRCLRDPGHDGPCAAAPLTGDGACPDINRCIERGCQVKCGPAARSMGLADSFMAIFGFKRVSE